MFNSSSGRSHKHTEQQSFLLRMTPSAEIIRTTRLPQFGGVYFGLKKQYKIVLNIVNFFLIVFDSNKNIKN